MEILTNGYNSVNQRTILESVQCTFSAGQFQGVSRKTYPWETTILLHGFELGAENDVGTLSPILRVRSEGGHSLRRPDLVQERLVQFVGSDSEHFLIVNFPEVPISVQLKQLPEGSRNG